MGGGAVLLLCVLLCVCVGVVVNGGIASGLVA